MDFVPTSETKERLKIQLGISENFSNKRRFIIHPIKTVVVPVTHRKKQKVTESWTINER